MDIIKRLNENSSKLSAATAEVRAFVNGLTDSQSFVETDAFAAGPSFLDGSDALGEGVLTGYATLNAMPVYIFVQNSAVHKGSLGAAQAAKIEKCVRMAIRTGSPLISVIDSAGARIGEGTGVLEGYAKILRAASDAKGIIPHIAVIKGASAGLMSAYAALADVVIAAEKGATVSLSAPSVVLASVNKSAAEAEKQLGAAKMTDAGIVSLSYSDTADLKLKVQKILDILSGNDASSDDANRTAPGLDTEISCTKIIEAVTDKDSAVELGNSDEPIRSIIARVNGVSVAAVVSNAGVNGGRLDKAALLKIQKTALLASDFGLPFLAFVNSQGAAVSLAEEQSGLAAVAAQTFYDLATLDVPKIAVVFGNAIGLSYSLLASKEAGVDYTLAFAGASIAPLSADTAVNFMYLSDIQAAADPVAARQKLTDTYTEREGNPFVSAHEGFVDNIIKPSSVRPYVASALAMLGN